MKKKVILRLISTVAIAKKCIDGQMESKLYKTAVHGVHYLQLLDVSLTMRKVQNQIGLISQYNFMTVIVDWPQNSCKIYVTLLITQSYQIRIEHTQIEFICGSVKTSVVFFMVIGVENCLRGGQKLEMMGKG